MVKKNSVATSTPRRKLGMANRARSTKGHAAQGTKAGFVAQEGGDLERDGGQDGEHPKRPALIAALGQRDDDARQDGGNQRGARQVEFGSGGGGRLRHQAPGGGENRQADGEFQHEHGAPAEVEGAPLHQRSAGELAGDGGEAHRDAVSAQRPGEVALVGAQSADAAQYPGHQQRGGHALQRPAGQQPKWADGQAAQQVGHREPRHAEQEHAAAAIQVAEAPSGDQEDGVAGGVHANDQLQFGGRRAEAGVDRGQSDVDDEEVDRGQEPSGKQDRQREPPRGGRLGRGGGHGSLPLATPQGRWMRGPGFRLDQTRASVAGRVRRGKTPVGGSDWEAGYVRRAWRAVRVKGRALCAEGNGI